MSRISAREALVASSAVSAVISLCILGSLTGSAPARTRVHHTGAFSRSTAGQVSIDAAGSRAAMSGSHQGVWFHIYDDSAASRLSMQPDILDTVLAGLPRSAASPAPQPAAAVQKTAAPAARKPAAVQEQTRSSVLAAVSNNPRDIAQAMAATRGWTGSEWVCLDKLWSHESMYETTVRNSVSGAYGIPQALPASKMASAGPDWRTNPVTQIEWGLSYIEGRYGTPCGAWSYWTRHYSY